MRVMGDKPIFKTDIKLKINPRTPVRYLNLRNPNPGVSPGPLVPNCDLPNPNPNPRASPRTPRTVLKLT